MSRDVRALLYGSGVIVAVFVGCTLLGWVVAFLGFAPLGRGMGLLVIGAVAAFFIGATGMLVGTVAHAIGLDIVRAQERKRAVVEGELAAIEAEIDRELSGTTATPRTARRKRTTTIP